MASKKKKKLSPEMLGSGLAKDAAKALQDRKRETDKMLERLVSGKPARPKKKKKKKKDEK